MEPSGWKSRPTKPDPIRGVHLCLITTLWQSWTGPFQAFCRMLRDDHKVPYGDTYIGSFLQAAGLRSRKPQTPVEAPWSSDTFRTFFPGAQWLGDGTTIAVHWEDRDFVFNVEAILDPATNAILAFHVSDTEDEDAVLQAYRASLETAGAPPLAFTLDNRPSNHTEGVQGTMEGTILLRSTPGRGQAKAPLEGTFGLFRQDMPPLVIVGQTLREMVRSALDLILMAWARGRNGKSRKRLGGLTPAEAYLSASPTPDEVQDALASFRELQRRQDLARRTREARRDPVRIQILSQGLAELESPDPEQRLAVALAGYAKEAIVRGLSVFQAKQELGTLPPGADPGRYLGGIIRNLDTRLEIERTAVHLLDQRIRLRDISLEPLKRVAEKLRARVPLSALPEAFVDLALEATCTIDFRFWALAAADALAALPPAASAALYQPLHRRIAASFRTDRDRRSDLIDRIAEAVSRAA